tara:strand:- start:2292 stop:2789 length:498 start_codon:yes stop_codon:yes gene_type:complete
MGEYRHRESGVVKTQGEWRKEYSNTSFPAVWTQDTLDFMKLDAVLPSPPATTTAYQTSVRDGVEQDSKGNWVEKYVAKDMFADTTVDGKTVTKAEHEKVYQEALDEVTGERNRSTRNSKLAETDFYGLSDVTMPNNIKTYRQALRDLPTHKNWPNLENTDWPTKP